MHRVLVDPGSATELLHLPAVMQMKVPLNHLSSNDRIFPGFNESTSLTMGDISLSVKVGPVTQQVLFLVVEDLGLYNAIVGRTWLHAMKAIPLLTQTKTYVQILEHNLPKDYCLIPGNDAIKLVEDPKISYS